MNQDSLTPNQGLEMDLNSSQMMNREVWIMMQSIHIHRIEANSQYSVQPIVQVVSSDV